LKWKTSQKNNNKKTTTTEEQNKLYVQSQNALQQKNLLKLVEEQREIVINQ